MVDAPIPKGTIGIPTGHHKTPRGTSTPPQGVGTEEDMATDMARRRTKVPHTGCRVRGRDRGTQHRLLDLDSRTEVHRMVVEAGFHLCVV